MKFTELNKRSKYYEKLHNTQLVNNTAPLFVRLDGRAFHTFTKNLNKPFDLRLSDIMRKTAFYLADEYNADLAYTQSDEITLFWKNDIVDISREIIFGGKVFKINSILASSASVYFYKELLINLPEKSDKIPVFDCRTWQVPALEDSAHVFMWRELDAIRNSLNAIAQTLFSHKKLQGKKGREIRKMISDEGVNLSNFNAYLLKGTYYKKVVYSEDIDLRDRSDIPESYRIIKPITRSKLIELDIPELTTVESAMEVLF